MLFSIQSTAQSNEPFGCGTPDLSPAERAELYDNPDGPQVSGLLSVEIPVWLTVVKYNSGFSYLNDFFAPRQIISQVNDLFSNGMQFYVCGFSYVYNDDWVILGTSNSGAGTLSEWGQLQQLIETQNAAIPIGYINIFIVQSFEDTFIGGIAGMPSGPSQRGSVACQYSPACIAHELGHYFGLQHTFAGGHIAQAPSPQLAQYVDDPVTINGVTYSGWQTGDLIPDTPADPGRVFCPYNSPACPIINNCSVSDPLGKTYTPDPTLIMSYYLGCQSRFTANQDMVMNDNYLNESRWAFLRDPANAPTCQGIPNNIGFIIRNCEDINLNNTYTPIKDIHVPLVDETHVPCHTSVIPHTNRLGYYLTDSCVYPNYEGNGLLSILPDKNDGDALNGVTTNDLLQMSRHILGIIPFTSPFQLIAADENMSGSVTTTDIVNIRKVILGIKDTFIAGVWRFIPQYCFEDPAFEATFYQDLDPNWGGIQANPFAAAWTNPDEHSNPQIRKYVNSSGLLPNAGSWMDHVTIDPNGPGYSSPVPWSFWAVKVGDVNCTADSLNEPPQSPNEFFTTTPHSPILPNQTFFVQVKVNSNELVSAWQLGIEFAEDTLEFLEVLPGNSGEVFDLDNFGTTKAALGQLKALNFSPFGVASSLNNKSIFQIKMKALKQINNVGDHFHLNNGLLKKIFYDADGNVQESMGLSLTVSNNSYPIMAPSPPAGTFGDAKTNPVLVYPNPFENELIFNFSVQEDQIVRLKIFDATGSLVTTNDRNSIRGNNILKITDLDLSPGLYVYSLETNEGNCVGKILRN